MATGVTNLAGKLANLRVAAQGTTDPALLEVLTKQISDTEEQIKDAEMDAQQEIIAEKAAQTLEQYMHMGHISIELHHYEMMKLEYHDVGDIFTMRESLDNDAYWDYLQNNPEKKKEAADSLYAGYQTLIAEGKMTKEILDGMTEREKELLGKERVQALQASFWAQEMTQEQKDLLTDTEKERLESSMTRVDAALEGVKTNPTEEKREQFAEAMKDQFTVMVNIQQSVAARSVVEGEVVKKEMGEEGKVMTDALDDFDALLASTVLSTPFVEASKQELPKEIAEVAAQNNEAMILASNTLKNVEDRGDQEIGVNNAGVHSNSSGISVA